MKRTNEQLKKFLLDRVDKVDTGCWEWIGSTVTGYGKFRDDRKMVLAHRMSFLVFNGDIPMNMQICHKCDNRKCINPDHLFIGTQLDNIRDCVAKGRNYPNFAVNRYFGNKFRGVKVVANFIEYPSYVDAGIALGVADNTVRKRIKQGKPGYYIYGSNSLEKPAL